jgi:hypothetical protein
MHSSKEEPCKSMQSIMKRRHPDLFVTIEPNSLGSTRVQTTSFHTTPFFSLMMSSIGVHFDSLLLL